MTNPITKDLIKIFMHCVKAVHPQNLIQRSVQYNPTLQTLRIVNKTYDLQNKNVYVVGTGKAVLYMANEISNLLGEKIVEGIVSVPKGSLHYDELKPNNIKYYEGAENNLPDINAECTAIKVNELASKLSYNDILLVLVSGGGSSLLPLPQKPVTLDEKQYIIKALANAGADIKELNTVRKKLSALKGGQLALQAQPAQVISLILSDIVGDPLDLIASGPTTKNEDDPLKAINIIHKYNLDINLPVSIKDILNKGESCNEFPTDNVYNYIIGSNKMSLQAAAEEAFMLSYFPIEITNAVIGNVKEVVEEYGKLTQTICNLMSKNISLDIARTQMEKINIPNKNLQWLNELLNNENRSICLIFGGETTVEVKGSGKGGRNQQLALEFSMILHKNKAKLSQFEVYFLSAGTDGIDGPTDAAGAIGYINLISDAIKDGLDVENFLNNNDSYSFYKAFKEGSYHIVTGHTNTNVMDIQLIVIKKKRTDFN